MKKIICILGKQYSGKDTVARILLRKLNEFEFERVVIGDAIKIEYGRIHGPTYWEIDANKGIYRAGLTELGNKGRVLNADYWLKKLLKRTEMLLCRMSACSMRRKFLKKQGHF